MEPPHRRPAVPQVPLNTKFAVKDLVELPFPGSQSAVDGLITTYFDQLRRPSRTLYVLDTSGSMQGDRIDGLRQALVGLTGADESLAGKFNRFHGREQVTRLPFNTSARAALKAECATPAPRPILDQIRTTATSLDAAGGTAIYSSLRTGYDVLREQINADPRAA